MITLLKLIILLHRLMLAVMTKNMECQKPQQLNAHIILKEKKEFVKKLILKEEESFIVTLANGEKLLAQEIEKASDGILKGEVIFKLYDTYGFPKEMTIESAEEKGLSCDIDGFNKCMERQREMARNARDDEQSMHNQSMDLLNFEEPFTFTGYENTNGEAKITGLFKDGNRVGSI